MEPEVHPFIEKYLEAGLKQYGRALDSELTQNFSDLFDGKQVTQFPKYNSLIEKYQPTNLASSRKMSAQPTTTVCDQSQALALLQQGLNCMIFGGPGTGKTYLIQEYLAHLKQRSESQAKLVHIVAPTGKAAAKYAHLRSNENAVIHCGTYHRIFSLSERKMIFGKNARHPLQSDILIIDEISMIDLDTFAEMLQAVLSNTQIVCVGDIDQLPALEGKPIFNFLNDLISKANFFRVHLQKTYRFDQNEVNQTRLVRTQGVHFLRKSIKSKFIQTQEIPINQINHLISEILETKYNFVTSDKDFDLKDKNCLLEIYKTLTSEIILCPESLGWVGTARINHLFMEALSGKNHLPVPIIITKNDYQNQLFNGDIGILFKSDDGNIFAAFQDANQDIRLIRSKSLHHWQHAFAITVHKSQGSEFNRITLFLDLNKPEKENHNALLYTAITRAKNEARVIFFSS